MFRLSVFFVLAAMLMAAGCENSLPATVSGVVTMDGDALEGVVGEVMFHPSGGGAMAMAMAPLEKDGSFTIFTGGTKGLEPGTYNVAVRVAQSESAPSDGQTPPGQKTLSPAKYGDKSKSGLTAEVAAGKNEFEFDLITK